MIVKCEKCQVAFNINDSLIRPEGSKLRCSKCKHIFTVRPPETLVPLAVKPPVPPIRQPFAPQEERISSSELTGGEVTLTIVDFSQEVFDTIGGTAERYAEMGTIGKGGMGEVLLARDTQLLRKVAIKVLKKESVTPAALSFFLREAQITAQLDHPNIVPLYTVKRPAEGEKNVSFVMKLVKGKTFLELINKVRAIYTENPKAKLPRELTQRTFLEHFLKACDGITYAHRKGVVHRDIKPANIMVGDFGEVYVMDWGIAKMLRDDEQDMPEQDQQILTSGMSGGTEIIGTQPEGVLGTPSYMSPEQARGQRDVDTASDIFSLGAVLFEMVTLRPPRIGDAKQKLKWAKGGYLNRMIHMLPDRKIDPELKAIVHRATESEPQNRYPSISKMAEDLRCYLRGDEVSELPDNLPRKVLRWMGKHRQLTLILILGILLISSGVTIWGLHREQVAMKAAQIRESKLSHLQAQVSAQAHFIDSHFLRLEDLAASLANNAMYLIQDGPSNNERFYWLENFQLPENNPPDLNYSHLYKRPVSIEYPVVKVAPGVLREDVTALMHKLAPLRHHFKKPCWKADPDLRLSHRRKPIACLTVHGIPIRWGIYRIGSRSDVFLSRQRFLRT